MKKVIKNDASVSAVIGVILMVAITVAIAGTVYVYVSGYVNNAPLDEDLIYKVGVPQGFYQDENGTTLFVFNYEYLDLQHLDEDEVTHFIGQNVTLILQNYTGRWGNYDYIYKGIYLNLDVTLNSVKIWG